jgi:hypothetical protein
MATKTTRALDKLRAICLALPETSERLSHGAPTFFIRGKKTFALLASDHHSDGRLAMWCAAPEGVQAQLISAEPERFFRPPYVGPRGWIGVRLDVDVDWDEIAGIVHDAYRCIAPKALIGRMPSSQMPGR